MRKIISIAKGTTLLLASVAPVIANAQTAGPAAGSPNRENPQQDTSASPGLEDIVVTAQRRGENLQKVPISISAVTASMADAMGIKGTQDIAIAAPAVNFGETASGANISIRGVGASGSAVDEAANAVYIDGVYQAATPALALPLNNIERIEVAKGPQGTLFGRNSTGGVIQVITRDPPKSPTADLSLGYGNYQTIETQAYLGTGFTDTLAGDIALYYSHQGEGWGKNLATGKDIYKGRSFAARSKFRWEPSERTTVTLTGSYLDILPAASQGAGMYPGDLTLSAGGVAGTGYTGFYNDNHNSRDRKDVVQYQASGKLEQDLDFAKLVNITSYSKTKLLYDQDADGGPANIVAASIYNPVRTITEELQLLSPNGSPVTWAVGVFYLDNDNRLTPYNLTGLSQGSATAKTVTESRALTHSYSAYGQATFPIVQDTNLTMGLRYTIDKRSFDATITNPAGVIRAVDGNATDKKLTWRLGLDHRFSSDVLGYISYNRGYKSGLYNTASPTQPGINPEVIDAYEAGFKSQLFDNHLRFNVSAFYYNFKDIQVRTSDAAGSAVLLNAASAKLKGVDIDLTSNPVRNLTLQGGLSFIDATYKDFPSAPFLTPRPTGGFIQVPGNAAGNRIILTPKWVATLAGEYKIPSDVGTFGISSTVYFNSGYYFDPQNRLEQGEYALLNAGLSWTSPSGVFELRAWARNLTAKKYRVYATYSSTSTLTYPGAPQTYGLTLRARFQ